MVEDQRRGSDIERLAEPTQPARFVVFRGSDALHRVTPTEGPATRILVVFAFNERAGVRLSDSALATFYGRVVP